jgi:hypothetical protein
MTIYELAAFLIPVSAAVTAIITIGEDVKSPSIAVTSAASLCERSSGCHANDRHA